MAYFNSGKLLEQYQVSPPSGSVLNRTIPLTFFDLALRILDPPIHQLFFYKLQIDATHFMQSILPQLKHSLSLTLEVFFPFAGHLIWSPESRVPEIVYVDGDSVSFSAAESASSFDHLSGNHPREINEFAVFSSALLPKASETIGVRYPVMALLVTLFPESGICIGVTRSHAIADGSTISHFMRYWASLCGSLRGVASPSLSYLLPSFDRSTIVTSHEIEMSHLKYMEDSNITQQSFILPLDVTTFPTPTDSVEVVVGATFVIDLQNIEKLKKWIIDRIIKIYNRDPCFHFTSLVVTSALMWVCLIKAIEGNSVDDDSNEHFIVTADCRTHIDPPLPTTYFGNCVTSCFATMTKEVLVGKDGIVLAVQAISEAITSLRKNVSTLAANMLDDASEKGYGSKRTFGLVSSPKFKLYDVNFGWGKPIKIETILSASYSPSIMLKILENGSQANGGLEFGIDMKKHQMQDFAIIFEETINNL